MESGLSPASIDPGKIFPRSTLVVSAGSSVVPWRSQASIHSVIEGSQPRIFETREGGRHVAVLENPGGFNEPVASFVGERPDEGW